MNAASVTPVVVGVNASASSLAAVRAAAGQAWLHGCPLHIVHAFNWLPSQPEPTDTHPGTTANDLIRRAVTEARNVSPGLRITTRLLEGAPSSTLLRQARTAAMLAIGDGGLSRHVCLPTHASAVQIAARAFCTVLVARAPLPPAGPVLVGLDGSPAAERALDFAFDMAARNGTDLIIVRASSTGTGSNDTDQLWALTNLIAPREDKYLVTARIRILPGDAGAELVAESERARLVVIGARGQQPCGGLLGSAAQTLLHHSLAPLILVRGLMPPGRAQSDQRLMAAATS